MKVLESALQAFGWGCGCLIFVIAVLLVIALLVSGCAPAGTPTPIPTPVRVTGEELGSDYISNEVAADFKYEGNPIEVTGEIRSIEPRGSGFRINIRSGIEGRKTGTWAALAGERYGYIRCHFSEDQAEQAVGLAKGDTVTVQGTGGKYDDYIDINNCLVVNR